MRPKYQSIKQYICEHIDSGQWLTNDRVPSDNKLTKQFGVSRMTANRALKELADEGILVRVAGVGTFVAEVLPQTPLFEIKNIADEVRSRGHTYSAVLHKLSKEKVNKRVAMDLHIELNSVVFHSLVVHCENDIPVQLEDRYVNPVVAPHYIEQDFTNITPNEYLMAHVPLSEVEHIIEAILPDDQTQRLMSIEPNQPCLLVRRRTWSGQLLASSARLIHPNNRYHLGGRFIPNQ
jgi:GntR family histidine utilization transcriptional repressor